MTAQPPLPLVPGDARPVSAAAAIVEDDDGGRVFVHGNLAYAWDAGDTAGRRFAAVSLMRIKAATQLQVAEAFAVKPATVRRWDARLADAGIAGLLAEHKGPKRKSKLTADTVAAIRQLRQGGATYRAITAATGVSQGSVCNALKSVDAGAGDDDGQCRAPAGSDGCLPPESETGAESEPEHPATAPVAPAESVAECVAPTCDATATAEPDPAPEVDGGTESDCPATAFGVVAMEVPVLADPAHRTMIKPASYTSPADAGSAPADAGVSTANLHAQAACLSRMPRRVARTVLRGIGGATRRSYPAQARALRTETTINDTRDLRIGKRLTHLPALREIGFSANRRLLHVQQLGHDPITGTDALHAITDPVTTATGARVPGLRLADRRSHALLSALLVFRCQPNGFTNKDLRTLTGELRGLDPGAVTTGQITYDLRRLKHRGLITRVPGTHRYQVTDHGLDTAKFLTTVHDHSLPTGLAELAAPEHAPGRLKAAATAYRKAVDTLTATTQLAA